ncbi:hypothetical protein GCM10020331_059840 [Ectobacillus funiculus]
MINVQKRTSEDERAEKGIIRHYNGWDGKMLAVNTRQIQSEKNGSASKKEKYGWEFIFLGANIDAISTAAQFGINKDFAVDYHADDIGTQLNYEAVNEAVTNLRSGKKRLITAGKQALKGIIIGVQGVSKITSVRDT